MFIAYKLSWMSPWTMEKRESSGIITHAKTKDATRAIESLQRKTMKSYQLGRLPEVVWQLQSNIAKALSFKG